MSNNEKNNETIDDVIQREGATLEGQKQLIKMVVKSNPDLDSTQEIVEDNFKKTKGDGFFNVVFTYMKKSKLNSFAILISLLLMAGSTAISPLIIKELMKVVYINLDQNTNNLVGSWGMSWQSLIGLQIGMIVVIAIFTFIVQYLAGMLGKKIEIDLRNKTLEKLIEEDISYYSDKKIGDILTKVVSDTQILGDQAAIVPVTFLSAIFTLGASIAIMFSIDWKLSLVAVVVFVIILLLMFLAFAPLKKKMFQVRNTITEINGDVIDRINTIKLIKSSGTEEFEKKRFVDVHKDYYAQNKSLIISQSVLITILLVGVTSVEVIMVIAAALIYKNDLQNLAILLPPFITAVGILISPIMQLIRVTVGLVQATTAAKRIMLILKAPVRFNNHYRDKSGVVINNIDGNIVFKDVEFEYPEKPGKIIFPTFNFTFEKGKSYAFVGETGSGKSTISKLLLRYYDPTKGKVLINDNIDLRKIYLSSYLEHVGHVEQEPSILLGDVFENVRYGHFDSTDEQVIEVVKKAGLHDLIMSWPEGYKTILGERGFMLSGGQKQRLVIARMFLKDPQLLILDEATSALDNIVEKQIQKELDKLMVGRTTVSIAHRLSTIKNVDEIIVLAPGKGIVQRGTFNELLKVPGHFKNLYEAGKMSESK